MATPTSEDMTGIRPPEAPPVEEHVTVGGRLLLIIIVMLILQPVHAPSLWAQVDGARLDVKCPSEVPEGEAFQVSVATKATVEALTVHWLGKTLTPEFWWENGTTSATFLLGFGMKERLTGDTHTLKIELNTADGLSTWEKEIRRAAKDYPEQHLEVAKRFNEMTAAEIDRDKREKKATRAALAKISKGKRYNLPFVRPVPGEKSSDFGLRRFFNGEPKNPHGGLDLRAGEGAAVRACAAGTVVLAGSHYFAGSSVYIDHGEGVISMYFHLSKIGVKQGQTVNRDERIGGAGSSGRVTGPHLHWGVSVLGQLVDPLPLLGR